MCEGMMAGGKHKGKPCIKKAYYRSQGKLTCGMHSKMKRVKLKVNPNKKVNDLKKKEDHQVRG